MIMWLFLIFFIKAYVDKSMQFKWVPATYALKKK